eukprot:Skav216531  [mRNA]  locus=scaffold1003:448525:448800:- [translate_table: standard]
MGMANEIKAEALCSLDCSTTALGFQCRMAVETWASLAFASRISVLQTIVVGELPNFAGVVDETLLNTMTKEPLIAVLPTLITIRLDVSQLG